MHINLLIVLILCAVQVSVGELDHKIAYLQNGEVWVTDVESGTKTKLTNSGGTISKFEFSPTLDYLAYNDTLVNLTDKSVFRPISDMEGYSYYLNKWITAENILFDLSGEFDVADTILYNIKDKSQKSVAVGDAWLKYGEGTVSRDRSFLVYTKKDFPAALYRTDLKTGDVKNILSELSHYERMHISNNNRYILTLSCRNYLKNENIDTRVWDLLLIDLATEESRTVVSFQNKWPYKFGYEFSNDSATVGLVQKQENGDDTISLYDIEGESIRNLASIRFKEADPYGYSRRFLRWSPEDTYIMAYTFEENMWIPAIVECRNPSNPRYMDKMWGFVWVSDHAFLYNERRDVYLYDLISEAGKKILENATRVEWLHKSD